MKLFILWVIHLNTLVMLLLIWSLKRRHNSLGAALCLFIRVFFFFTTRTAWGNYDTCSLNGNEPQDPCTRRAQCELLKTDSTLKLQGKSQYQRLFFPPIPSLKTLRHQFTMVLTGGGFKVNDISNRKTKLMSISIWMNSFFVPSSFQHCHCNLPLHLNSHS